MNAETQAFRRTVLPNGVRVLTEAIPTMRSAAIGVWVGVGARDETPDRSGVSHFLEHLLFKGTEQRSARSIATAVDAVGGEMNAYTSREHTAYYLRLPVAELEPGLRLLADVVSEPTRQPWGFESIVADPDGHLWVIATHVE
jgi:predicted Zn-dependent peptidase